MSPRAMAPGESDVYRAAIFGKIRHTRWAVGQEVPGSGEEWLDGIVGRRILCAPKLVHRVLGPYRRPAAAKAAATRWKGEQEWYLRRFQGDPVVTIERASVWEPVT